MTLTAPARLNRQRGFRSATRFEQAGSAGPAGSLLATAAGTSQVVLMVDFSSPEGGSWWAVGVGGTLAEALAFAQDSCPTDTNWQPTRWNDLYGD
jgi:hypothetical protein